MNILAEFKKLKDQLATFVTDQSKATLASLTEFGSKLTALETGALADLAAATTENAKITGQLSESANANTKLGTDLATVNSTLAALNAVLTEACLSGGLLELTGTDGKPLAADATDEQKKTAALAIPVADKFKLYQGAHTAAFAKLGLPNTMLPAAPNKAAGTGGDPTTMKRAEFFKLAPAAQTEFCKNGGKLTD